MQASTKTSGLVMAADFLKTWLRVATPKGAPATVAVLTERRGQRAVVAHAIRKTVLDHFVGADIIASIGGLKKAAAVIRNALPADKIARSGDFGEILATEYVDQATEYHVPIRRLRYKDDRKMAMRGDDVLGFVLAEKPVRILKVESKSRIALTKTVLQEASDGLCRHQGRPNPSTLSFISRRLRERANHDFAELIERLQESEIPLRTIEHLIFTLSANDPAALMQLHATSPIRDIMRRLTGCVIKDHSSFISQVYDSAMREGSDDGDS